MYSDNLQGMAIRDSGSFNKKPWNIFVRDLPLYIRVVTQLKVEIPRVRT